MTLKSWVNCNRYRNNGNVFIWRRAFEPVVAIAIVSGYILHFLKADVQVVRINAPQLISNVILVVKSGVEYGIFSAFPQVSFPRSTLGDPNDTEIFFENSDKIQRARTDIGLLTHDRI